MRRARVKALAKLNLDLRVLYKRPDGYHELRTVFQTVSLADRIEIAFTPSKRTEIRLEASVEIQDNLMIRAARACLDEMRVAGRVEMRLAKTIPMGAGLGGGSSDAAAVLLALPVLAGGVIALERLLALARALGSDVPFFLLGGTAAGIGRGDELYPLPDAKPRPGVLVAPGLHVSTTEAYRALARPLLGELTSMPPENNIDSFQSRAWHPGEQPGRNDFEAAVFLKFPLLQSLKDKLMDLGAEIAMMTGSGSSLFGLFRTRQQATRAVRRLQPEKALEISLVS
ncbi:MAG: 4-(cytidine 5'-diphospho)-2-C-methyl-D-erythritol kinase, partial [Bryobacteraceae bacterium]